jgi:hypothetical protein
MEETTSKTAWLQDAIKKGLILGIIHTIVFLIIYYVVPNKLTGFSYLFFIFAFNIGYVAYQGINWRKEVGGYLDYGSAFKYSFVLLTANGLLGMIISAVFLLIEPSFPEVFAQSQLDTSIYWAQKFGAPDDALEGMREKFDSEEITKRFSLVGQLIGFGFVLIFYAIGSLITALFIRKNKPETF